jgi:hypothetical protein
MNVIRKAITQGVTAFLIKINLVPIFMKEGTQETMKDALTM